MSTVIAMAYAQYGPVMHLASSARHLEEIRRVTSRLSELVTESERARLDLQMLFGVHVYARAKVVPDLAISRGEEAHRAARLQGDRAIEFLAAGGVAMAPAGAGRRRRSRAVDRAGGRGCVHGPVADRGRDSSRPGAGSSGRVPATWKACAGTSSARSRWRPRAATRPARCEALARLAIEAARIVGQRTSDGGAPDPALIELVERSAAQVKELLPLLPGHAPWGAQADAAPCDGRARARRHRGRGDGRGRRRRGPPGRRSTRT